MACGIGSVSLLKCFVLSIIIQKIHCQTRDLAGPGINTRFTPPRRIPSDLRTDIRSLPPDLGITGQRIGGTPGIIRPNPDRALFPGPLPDPGLPSRRIIPGTMPPQVSMEGPRQTIIPGTMPPPVSMEGLRQTIIPGTPRRDRLIDLQRMPLTGRIAASAGLRGPVPGFRPPGSGPRIDVLPRLREGPLPSRRMVPGFAGRVSEASFNPLSLPCARPRSVRCFSWPENRDPRDAFRCDGGCPGRICAVVCECSCVHPMLIERLRSIGRIRGPELMPLARAGQSDELARARLVALRNIQSRRQDIQTNAAQASQGRTGDIPQTSGDGNRDLSFGISDEVLATLIAQPALNAIVGPQGINKILAGVPPPLLPRNPRRDNIISDEISRPEIRLSQITETLAQPLSQFPERDSSGGIPVPMSRINFEPGTENEPSLGNMQIMVSEIRPFQDATTGLNIDLPTPRPTGTLSRDRDVRIRQLPGSNVLFVDLTKQQQSNGKAALQTVPSRLEMSGDRPGNHLPSSSPEVFTANTNWNNIPRKTFNQTLPGSAINRSSRTFVFSNPSKDECLAQRLELWCDPQAEWEGTPGVSRWCLQNCRSDNCDNQRCACACIEVTLFKSKNERLSLRAP